MPCGGQSYGKKSNDELLQLFGFVEPDNPHDAFLSIGLAEYLAMNCFAGIVHAIAGVQPLLIIRPTGGRRAP